MSAYLFSVDLEDPRDTVRDGQRYPDRVPHNTERLLAFLQQYRVSTTFFVVGHIARRHPQLIRSIVAAGHEVACHTTGHIPLTEQTAATLRADLQENIALVRAAGACDVTGLRAQVFWCAQKTQLADAGVCE